MVGTCCFNSQWSINTSHCIITHKFMLNLCWIMLQSLGSIQTIVDQNPAGLSDEGSSSGKVLLGCKYLTFVIITAWLRIALERKVSDLAPSWYFKLGFIFSLSLLVPLVVFQILLCSSSTIGNNIPVFKKHSGFKPTGRIYEWLTVLHEASNTLIYQDTIFLSFKWTYYFWDNNILTTVPQHPGKKLQMFMLCDLLGRICLWS